MSEMVERVARALWRGFAPKGVAWEQLRDTRENCLAAARCAIDAMRVPTNEMCEAGSLGPTQVDPVLPAITTSQADAAFSAMIAEALK